MKLPLPLSACLAVLLYGNLICVTAQDKIYLKESTKQGKIISIADGLVKYQPSNDQSRTLTVPIQSAQLLFTDRGKFLLPSQIAFAGSEKNPIVQEFLAPQSGNIPTDKVYTTDGIVATGDIITRDANLITIRTVDSTLKIPSKRIAVLILKTGMHQIVGTLDEAIMALTHEKLSQPSASYASQPANQPVTTPSAASTPAVLRIGDVAPGVTQEEFTAKAVLKTRQFSDYLKLLCDKKSRNNLELIVNQAVDLFVNEEALIQVSSVNNPEVQQIPIRKYLERMILITYDAVDLEWTKVQYIGSVKANPDGTYSGIVSFEQKFTGYLDGQVAYEDITRKEAQVILKTYEKTVEGAKKLEWEVMLSDVKVVFTKKPNA